MRSRRPPSFLQGPNLLIEQVVRLVAEADYCVGGGLSTLLLYKSLIGPISHMSSIGPILPTAHLPHRKRLRVLLWLERQVPDPKEVPIVCQELFQACAGWQTVIPAGRKRESSTALLDSRPC